MIKISFTPKLLYYILTACLILLILLAFAGTFVGNRILTERNNKLTELKVEQEVLAQQKQALIQAKQDLEKYAELEQTVKQVVPQEKDQVRTVREIVKFASEADINLGLVGFQGSELGNQPGNVELTQLEPVPGLSGVYNMEITVSNSVPSNFNQLIDFIRGLESNRRTSQIIEITINPAPSNRTELNFTITFNVFIKPEASS